MESKICYLIDDDEDDREIFAAVLSRIDESISLRTATSGKEALQTLIEENTFTPDYIFVDMHMPVVDGKQCLMQIKRIRRLKSIPIVMYTTSISPEDMDDAWRLGAAAYIRKPYNLSVLRDSLQAFFVQYHLKSHAYEH